jgi:PAS domain S-box-containing protein
MLDESGIVLESHGVGANARFLADVAEGTGLTTHIHPDDRQFFELTRFWAASSTGKSATIQLRWARDGGRWTPLFATIEAISEETIRVSLRADDAVAARRAEAQLRRVVEGSAQGIIVRTAQEVLYMNDAFAHLIGYSSARELTEATAELAAQGTRSQANASIHPDDVALVEKHLHARLAGQETISNYEFRLIRRDGTIVWVHTFAGLTTWDGQRASLSWMSDISDRKRMEEELRRSTEAAEFANRTKTEFLANMSHELRTPLNAILGFSEVIRDEMFGPAGAKYAEYARDIHLSGAHLLEIINDVLDLSKLEAGKLDLRESEVSLAQLTEECIVLVRNKAEEGHIRLVNSVPRDLPLLRADARAVKQVILNLLSNAVKFTPEKGQVTIAAAYDGKDMCLWVSDTGIGMTPEQMQIALSPFGQVDSKLARKHDGTGLGLPICRSLMELHGGSLELSSEPNRGTTTTARFPRARVGKARAA